jgi:type IV pilus assembly protein PilE
MRFYSQRGFTLIELMVVVGIIGILVALAAPNFARYQSKARQAEAKIFLSSVFAAEKSFYSEYSAYGGGMDAIGFSPEGAKRFYSLGFSASHTGNVSGFTGNLTTVPSYARTNFPSTWTSCTPDLNPSYPTGAVNDPQGFTAAASGQIRDAQPCDLWVIDSDKVIANLSVSL